MSKICDVAVIGAGPYGLSLAAHLASCGIDFRIFGKPLSTWSQHMPKNMTLKSDGFARVLRRCALDVVGLARRLPSRHRGRRRRPRLEQIDEIAAAVGRHVERREVQPILSGCDDPGLMQAVERNAPRRRGVLGVRCRRPPKPEATGDAGGLLRYFQSGRVQRYALLLFGSVGILALALLLANS